MTAISAGELYDTVYTQDMRRKTYHYQANKENIIKKMQLSIYLAWPDIKDLRGCPVCDGISGQISGVRLNIRLDFRYPAGYYIR